MNAPNNKPSDASPSASQDRPQRLFFALWPGDSLRQQLVSRSKPLAQAVHGRSVPTENLHITLAFLGSVDAGQRVCVEDMAANVARNTAEDVACSPFALTLDRFGYWSRPRVLWFGASETPEPLRLLADSLSAGARECGLSLDARPYSPHLTLMRKVSRAPEKRDIEPISWSVDRFVLVNSVTVPQGVRYEVVREWLLRESAEC